MNDLATQSRHLRVDAPVAITGYLHAEPYDMPDRSIWHRVEIIAYEIEQPADPTAITNCVGRALP